MIKKVIGRDDREPVATPQHPPYGAICHLKLEGNSTEGNGTAFLVEPGLLLTAAHNLHHEDYGGSIRNGTFQFAGTTQEHEFYAEECYTYPGWLPSYLPEYDIGAIQIEPKFPSITALEMKALTDEDLTTQSVAVAGFDPEHKNYPNVLLEAIDIVTETDAQRIYYKTDATQGQSGSPLFLPDRSIVVGVHAYGYENEKFPQGDPAHEYNSATRLTQEVIEYFVKLADEYRPIGMS